MNFEPHGSLSRPLHRLPSGSPQPRRFGGEDGRSPVLLIFAASAVIAAGLAVTAWWMHTRITRPLVRPPLDAEARAYLQQIVVADARMSAAETPLGGSITYLDARVINQGSRTVREIDLRLDFMDLVGQMVLRRTVRPVTSETAPLGPGESRSLHVTFDHMPAEWNQAPPVSTPTYVSF